MFKSILRAAIRNISRHKAFSLINLIGLSVSMSLCMLVILIVREQYTYDKFHQDADRIYQLNATLTGEQGMGYDIASVPLPVANIVRDEYSIAEEVVSVTKFVTADASSKHGDVALQGLFVDDTFLNVFNFPLMSGNKNSALTHSKNIILTQLAAKKLFGNDDPIGKIVSLGNGYGEYTVSGIFSPLPGKTHLEFDVVVPSSALSTLDKSHMLYNVSSNWDQPYSSYVYVKLKDGSVDNAAQAVAQASEKYGQRHEIDGGFSGYQFKLLPLDQITPGLSTLFNQIGSGIPMSALVFVGVLAAVVLIMSIFNFTNLTIAKSLTRAKEIGVRKIAGAKRSQVFSQFIGESIVFAFLALIISYLVLQLLKFGVNTLWLSADFSLALQEDGLVYVLFAVFGIIVGSIAGVLPAFYLSAFKPLSVLRESANLRVYSKLTFRKILVATQFTFSIIFVITVLIVYRQMDYMVHADYGFKKEGVLNVSLQGVPFEKAAPHFGNLAGVDNVAGVSHVPGTWNSRSAEYRKSADAAPVSMNHYLVEDTYAEQIDLTFLAGRNFDRASEGTRERHIILNEEALTTFGLGDPMSAIGESILLNDSITLQVIGVVKDFHYRPLSDHIGPMALRYDPKSLDVLSISFQSTKRAEVIALLEKTWEKIDPEHELAYHMMEDDLKQAYRQSGMSDMLAISGYVTVLAVTLACLGMLGMSLYAVQTREKEIGIRRVIGASSSDIIILLGKSFFLLIGIAITIGVPISLFIGDQFLSSFAFRTSVGLLVIGGGILIIVLLGIAMVVSTTLKAAITNPVKSLKYE